jgi:hypothetical protein
MKLDSELAPQIRSYSSEEKKGVSFDFEAGQPPSRISSGVDIDPIWSTFWLKYWRMSMNDDFLERLLVQEEILPDPEQVVIFLPAKRNAGSDAGMHKKIVAIGEG